MNYILFDGQAHQSLLPLTYTRPVADVRIGILTIREKWEKQLGYTTSTLTEEYLEEKYPMVEFEANVMINASFLPTKHLVNLVQNLQQDEAIFYNDEVVAFYTNSNQEKVDLDSYVNIPFENELIQIRNPWDIFKFNDFAIKEDFNLLTNFRSSSEISRTNNVINPENIFIEAGAKVEFATLNASEGPIYIGKDAEVMEGSLIRGPFALGEHSVVKMGAKIYGATTIGPHCKVGGEVNNTVIFGYSNKAHDGFLGNAVIGEWCNLGADTNNSNLKNNYADVKLWNYESEKFINTGLQFCGLIMGDHSKCGINTMFNTGTLIGVCCNIYGGNFPRNFIPSFSWGGSTGFTEYKLNKVFEVATKVMKRRMLDFDKKEENILHYLFKSTSKYRKTYK